MKKFSLNSVKASLTRDEMRQVNGGLYQSCGYRNDMGPICGLSMAEAQNEVAQWGGWWCCSSCASNGGSASYC